MNCKEVWLEISNYIDGEIDAALCERLEDHFENCRHCAAVVDSVRNILYLVADERIIELPIGFSDRMHKFISFHISKT